MTIEARNLPAKPSSVGMKEGQAENRRVEILSSDLSILAPIRSTYVSTRTDSTTLTLQPDVTAPYGIASWKVTISNAAGILGESGRQGGSCQGDSSSRCLPRISRRWLPAATSPSGWNCRTARGRT